MPQGGARGQNLEHVNFFLLFLARLYKVQVELL